MDLPASVRDVVLQDIVNHFEQVEHTAGIIKKISVITGRNVDSKLMFKDLENLVNNHLSSSLSSAELELELFLVKKKYRERATTYFLKKIIAEEVVKFCLTHSRGSSEASFSNGTAKYVKSSKLLLQHLIDRNLAWYLDMNQIEESVPLTQEDDYPFFSDLTEQIVSNADQTLKTLSELLPDSEYDVVSDEPTTSIENVDFLIQKSFEEHQKVKGLCISLFYEVLDVLSQCLKRLHELLNVWSIEKISSSDQKILELQHQSIEIDILRMKLEIMQRKLFNETYSEKSRKQLEANKRILSEDYKKLLHEEQMMKNKLEQYEANNDQFCLIASEYRKVVDAIRQEEKDIKYFQRLKSNFS